VHDGTLTIKRGTSGAVSIDVILLDSCRVEYAGSIATSLAAHYPYIRPYVAHEPDVYLPSSFRLLEQLHSD